MTTSHVRQMISNVVKVLDVLPEPLVLRAMEPKRGDH